MLTPAEFRALHRPGAPLLLPNAWDLASARWLHAAGYEVLGTTSLGVAAVAGLPDGAGVAADATLHLARRLTSAGLTVTVDIEAGFSTDPAAVGAYAAALAALGVVGVNIEDSAPDGDLLPAATTADRIAAIASAAPGLFVNARTDAFWIESSEARGDRLAEAVGRLRRYEAAGASGVFVPGVLEAEEVRTLVAATALPLNMLVQPPGGFDLRGLARLGVARVSTGSLLVRAALGAVVATLAALEPDASAQVAEPQIAEARVAGGPVSPGELDLRADRLAAARALAPVVPGYAEVADHLARTAD
ncbi:isocitrate lyase/phosphoenolpyruvate mutase family protein [Agromyces sp. G08B096]|uniref:Isocitrate lyase/phosphoenolpyruvate mutase family protein n=1 Tax=Agromyces sp. G08B096 TaxID=3156399 RepID=A0AAU7W559_9MICO